MYVKFAVMSMILQWAIRITESLPELPLRIFRIPGAVRNAVPAKMNSLQKIDKSIRQVKIMRSAILLAVENNAWAAFCIHTIKADNHKGSGHYIFESQADQLFAYTEQLSKENKVWVANLTDAYLYAIERATSTVDTFVDENGNLTVSLTCTETDDIYDMPLTVKVCLPDGKTGATLDGKELTSVEESGSVYVYVDVAPGCRLTLQTK